jgi:hypothetical protein
MHQTEIFLMKQIEKYKAQVERVRELCAQDGVLTAQDVLKALDGEQ